MVFTIALVVGLAFFVYERMGAGLIDHLVVSESRHLIANLDVANGTWSEPFEREISPVMFAWGEHPSRPAAGMPAMLRTLPNGLHGIKTESGTWHVMVSDALDGRFYVLYDATDNEELARSFGLALLLIALALMGVSYLVGSRVARWVASPLKILTDRLAQWAPGSPTLPISLSDEGGRLIEAFNRVQDQVDDSIAREREFSANLHHEVRTPLSRIRSDSELMLRLSAPSQEDKRRLRRIVQAVQEVTESLENAYDIAHAEQGPIETVSLYDCVDDVFTRLELEADNAALDLVNSVDRQQLATLNRHSLLTVMRNLVRNAIAHAAPATLDVYSIEGGLAFADSGPGISPDEQRHVFDRYYSSRLIDQNRPDGMASAGGDGRRIGLGLAIARRICATHGWDITLASGANGVSGSIFYLVFSRPGQPQADALPAG